MKTSPLIILLLALTATGILGGLYWRASNHNAQLKWELVESRADNQRLNISLSATQQFNKKQQSQLGDLDAELGKTKSALTSAKSRNIIRQREISDLEQSLNAAREAQRELRGEVNALTQTLAEARASEASAETIASYQQAIRDLERQLASAKPSPRMPILTTHRSRSTRVVSVGPSNAFVVLNYGASHGALPAQKMDILRGTKLVATVQISDVRDNYSIAQVRPDSLRDSLQKGDTATLTP